MRGERECPTGQPITQAALGSAMFARGICQLSSTLTRAPKRRKACSFHAIVNGNFRSLQRINLGASRQSKFPVLRYLPCLWDDAMTSDSTELTERNAAPSKARIFISYSRTDEAFAISLGQ